MPQPITLLMMGICFAMLYLRFQNRPKDAPRRTRQQKAQVRKAPFWRPCGLDGHPLLAPAHHRQNRRRRHRTVHDGAPCLVPQQIATRPSKLAVTFNFDGVCSRASRRFEALSLAPRRQRRFAQAFARGEFFSLLGPSGCGKTTTLRLIAGFEEPTSRRNPAERRSHQAPEAVPAQRQHRVSELRAVSAPHRAREHRIRAAARTDQKRHREGAFAKCSNWCSLTGKESRRPAQLSGGERQRVALARSLVLAPDVLLLDEPLSALDPNLRKQVRAELKDMQRRVGITFLFVTHDQEEALSHVRPAGVMNAGALRAGGHAEEIYLRPRTRFVASFLGAVNWIGDVGVRPEAMRIAREPPAERRALARRHRRPDRSSWATASTSRRVCESASPWWRKSRA